MLDSVLRRRADDHELIHLNLAEHTIRARLIEWIDAALVQNNLIVGLENITRKVRAPVRRKCHPVLANRIRNLPAPFSPQNAIRMPVARIINLLGGYHPYILHPRPRHYPAHILENTAMVANARIAAGKQEVLLRVDVYDDPPTSQCYNGSDHLRLPCLTAMLPPFLTPDADEQFYQTYRTSLYLT